MGNEEACKLMREKYWSELDDSEKITRTREVVKQQGEALANIRKQLCDLREHSHAEGKMVVPLDNRQGRSEGIYRPPAGKEDDVRF